MTNQRCYQVEFTPSGKRARVEENSTLLTAAQKADVPLSATCGGRGRCGQCRVTVLEGKIPSLTEHERLLLSADAIAEGERLACLIPIAGDMTIEIPEDSSPAGTRLQLEGTGQSFTVQPLVSDCRIEVSPSTRDDNRSDFGRVVDALITANGPGTYSAKIDVVRQLPAMIRNGSRRLNAYLKDTELLGLGLPDEQPLGVAVDLGTTKIAASLLDLQTGKELSARGSLNPQVAFGGDLISRLTYANTSEENAKRLRDKVCDVLATLLDELTESAGVQHHQITDLCIVGNTAMAHLLLQLPVAQLAGAPYVAATHTSITLRAKDLDLNTAPGATVHITGSLGGFVGGDHVSMILASRLYQSPHVTLGIDIGTNTEIGLYIPANKKVLSCSCASGPAFEGAHMNCGMRAAEGAIETAKFSEGTLFLSTIGNTPPKGVCGSGVIDILAELCRAGLLSASGQLDRNCPLVRIGPSGPELLLAPASEAEGERDIVITQKDISEIQLAKGAIKAGIEALLNETCITPEDVAEVIVAGAFGSYLDLANVRDIGMFPDFGSARLHQIGNAALEGAKMMLLSKDEREIGEKIILSGDYLETSTAKGFNRLFARGIQFPKQVHHS